MEFERMKNFLLSCLLATAAAWYSPAMPTAAVAKTNDVARIVFHEVERRIIQDYFDRALGRIIVDDDRKSYGKGKKKHKYKSRGKSKGIPPGLAGRKQLPPGIRKQIAQGKRLPYGTDTYSLPADLRRRLPSIQGDVDRRVVGDDIILIQRGTNLVLDILVGVLRK